MAVTNTALAARLDAIADDLGEIKALQKVANGRISKIELARERERGAREAVADVAASTAKAAAETALALREQQAQRINLRDRSRTFWVTVASAAVGSVGGVVTLGTLAAHFILNH